MATIQVLHGPNLNLLGTREPEHYGTSSLSALNQDLMDQAKQGGHTLTCQQSNAEHELINAVQAARSQQVHFIIINPAAYTHTSIALRDALKAVQVPFIEVHLSNIYAREPFRRQSYFSDLALGVISGFGVQSYQFALQAAMIYLQSSTRSRTAHGYTKSQETH